MTTLENGTLPQPTPQQSGGVKENLVSYSAHSDHTSTSMSTQHHWQSDGLSSYPPRDPLVGQSQFFNDFESFIHLVDKEENEFTQVFSMVAEWGRGKSRLGYELIAQINDASPGWFCRDVAGDLKKVSLFRDDADREQYLGLYIRYSQIATEFQNSDNWFAYGLYTALQPLAKNTFDGSIQSQVAKQCFDRLEVEGFNHQELARCLELDKQYSDQDLYDDEFLVTRLVNAAYEYLKHFGIKYVMVVLDELETAAEAATYGLEGDDLKRLDGRAIKLMGQAIKEEDPRRKLPWLRYVALCSPAIGEELREVSSLNRRFSLLDLEHNAFSDVSDYVATLKESGRLAQNYLAGLVEAAYAMSGGNFGWFNVIMAAVDEKLISMKMNKEPVKTIGQLFNAVLKSSPRIRDHVLDAGAINAIQANLTVKEAATELLFSQLPVALGNVSSVTKTLVDTVNEYEEPVASYYRLVSWGEDGCRKALMDAKFTRVKGELWEFSGIEQKLDLKQLLANLATYAIHESAGEMLIPTSRIEFIELLQLLYPHGATDDAARALWLHFFGDQDVLTDTPTHIGPSVAMLNRLNLRYRKQSQHSLIFKAPDAANAHEAAMKDRNENAQAKQKSRLTGLMRVLDHHWQYDPVSSELNKELVTIATNASRARQDVNGLASCRALQLHPKGRLVLAYVTNELELIQLCKEVSAQFSGEGRYPVLAVTSSIDLGNKFKNASDPVLQKAKDYLLLYRLSHNEEHVLEQVGLPKSDCRGFELNVKGFTTKFMQRLNSLERGLLEGITVWRQGLHERGLIAAPLRASQKLNDKDLEVLVDGWADLVVRSNVKLLSRYDQSPQSVDDGALYDLVKQLRVPAIEINDGYGEQEWSQIFSSTDELTAQAQFPEFICRLMRERIFKGRALTYEQARQDWFFAYNWLVNPKDVFNEWMSLLRTALLVTAHSDPAKPKISIFKFHERSAFTGRYTEADNWLTIEYPKRVDEISNLFGAGRIGDLFSPKGRKKVGAKTNTAIAKLKIAKEKEQVFTQVEEITLPSLDDIQRYSDELASTCQARFVHQQAVAWVFESDNYKEELAKQQFTNLDFEQDLTPLWQRIAKAKAFADQVYQTEQAVTTRVAELISAIDGNSESQTPFPRNIFTLALEKIARVLSGAVRPGIEAGATQEKQQTEAGTLGYFLRNLDVSAALKRLDHLANEVGYSTVNQQTLDLENIDGAIISTYRELLAEFSKLKQRAVDAENGLQQVTNDLLDVPADYSTTYPDGLSKRDNLSKKIKHIDSLFDNVQDDANQLKDRVTADLQLGQFRSMLDQVPPLLDDARRQLTQWLGDIETLKNYNQGYREQLLKKQTSTYDQSLNVLRKVKKQAPVSSLTLLELEKIGSLSKAENYLKLREKTNKDEIDTLLSSSIVSAERWTHIVKDVADGIEPGLSLDEESELLAKSLIVRTFRLGGA